jgi:hypothetical protein
MSEIRIATGHLVALLVDLTHTAAADAALGPTAGILLHSEHGHIGAEPGKTALLAGTSTNGRAAGHTYSACSGHLPPMLWRIDDVRAVLAVLRPRLKDDREHVTEIHREGDTITVGEDPDLFGESLRVVFPAGPIDEFPHGVWSLLSEVHLRTATRDETGSTIPPAAPRTDIAPDVLEPFLKVARARKSPLEIYRYHQRYPLLIAIGDNYRGVALPIRWTDDNDRDAGAAPDGDVYVPSLPPPRKAAAT